MVRYMAVAQIDLPHLHRVPRPAADSALLAVATRELRAALADDGAAVPILTPIGTVGLIATSSPNNLYVTLVNTEGARLALMGVARRATAAPRVWGEMTERTPTQLDRPAWPWVALTVDYALLPQTRPAAAWLVSYAAGLAWAWIDGESEIAPPNP